MRKPGLIKAVAGVAPKSHEDACLQLCPLGFEPGPTRADLARIRSLCTIVLPGAFELEVLDDIGDIDLLAIESGGSERAIEHFTSWSNERLASKSS